MWDSETKIIDRAGLPENRHRLAAKIQSLFKVPARGVAFVFDDKDYEYHLNPVWRNKGCHMNIKVGGIEQMSPGHLLEIMESRKYANLIWLSRSVCIGTDLEFAWLLSHELRHLEQDLLSCSISSAGYFLYLALGLINIEEPKLIVTVPYELDAELAAWRVSSKIFGGAAAANYIDHMASTGNLQESFKKLKSYDPYQCYDVVENTVNLLLKYKKQFQYLQQVSEDEIIKNFNINKTCAELHRLKRDRINQ